MYTPVHTRFPVWSMNGSSRAKGGLRWGYVLVRDHNISTKRIKRKVLLVFFLFDVKHVRLIFSFPDRIKIDYCKPRELNQIRFRSDINCPWPVSSKGTCHGRNWSIGPDLQKTNCVLLGILSPAAILSMSSFGRPYSIKKSSTFSGYIIDWT